MTQDNNQVDNLVALLDGYFDKGGHHLNVNVLDREILKDAQAHPENYRDLMVRIWGFSAFFTQIDKHWQDHIIARTTLNF